MDRGETGMEVISVVIPVYNVRAYIRKCVSSVQTQSYSDLEIILVDDGSTDDSGQICDELAEADPRIVVLHKPNGGLSDARNHGMAAATGAYILFVDSDDYIHPDMIQTMYTRMQQDGSQLVICDFCKVDPEGQPTEAAEDRRMHSAVVSSQEAFALLCGQGGWQYVPAWNKLYSRQALDGIRFPCGKLHEDEYIIHRVLDHCASISILEQKLYFYVQRSGSIMSALSDKNRIHCAQALLERAEFFCAKGQAEFAHIAFGAAVDKLLGVRTEKKSAKELADKLNRLAKASPAMLSGRKETVKFALLRHFLGVYGILGRVKKLHRTLAARCRDSRVKRGITRIFVKVRLGLHRLQGGTLTVLMATPMHGNLGDQAIVYAQKVFLRDQGLRNILEINRYEFAVCEDLLKEHLGQDVRIVITGGGNLGSLWPEEDALIGRIIEDFARNRIVVFPQTCYYDGTAREQARLEENRRIYAGCKNLTVALRDRPSYAFFREQFPDTRAILVPDMVLYLAGKVGTPSHPAEGVLLCFRNDKERVTQSQKADALIRILQEEHMAYTTTDTVVFKRIHAANRARTLKKKWREFSGARLVITDRLHGMIFAVIHGCACIAVNNINGKVGAVYSAWLSRCPNVVCTQPDAISPQLLSEALQWAGKPAQIDQDAFSPLGEAVLS